MFSCGFLLLILCLGGVLTDEHTLHGTINTKQDLVVLGNHCFPPKDSGFYYNIVYPKSYAPLTLMLIDDDQKGTFDQAVTCDQKMDVLKREYNQLIQMTPILLYSFCSTIHQHGQEYYSCHGHRRLDTAHDRRWYFAVSHCSPLKGQSSGLQVTYTLTFLNDGAAATCTPLVGK